MKQLPSTMHSKWSAAHGQPLHLLAPSCSPLLTAAARPILPTHASANWNQAQRRSRSSSKCRQLIYAYYVMVGRWSADCARAQLIWALVYKSVHVVPVSTLGSLSGCDYGHILRAEVLRPARNDQASTT